jgi:hypothetical protein
MARRLAAIYLVAVMVNYPWERAQAQLYVGPAGASIGWWLCLTASLVDGLLVLLMFGLGWIMFRRRDWFEQPGIPGYLLLVVSGAILSVGIEWATVYGLQWWAYSDLMPLVPGLGVGVAPLAQMLLLPALIFRLVSVWQHRRKLGKTSEQ